MTDMLETHIKELERERDDWKEILAAYGRSNEDGLRAQSGKEERCGLCPKYRIVFELTGNTILSCRSCPIVLYSGRTCAWHCRKTGIKAESVCGINYGNIEMAKVSYGFLRDLIERLKNNG